MKLDFFGKKIEFSTKKTAHRQPLPPPPPGEGVSWKFMVGV